MPPGSVLVLTARAGTGHLRAAEAISSAVGPAAPELTVEQVDVLDLAPSGVEAAYADAFEMLADRAPRVWRRIYRHTDGPDTGDSTWWSLAERFLFRGFRDLLTSRPWDLCVCTHFLPCQLAAGRPPDVPFWLVLTDFQLHRYWVQPAVERYFVPPGGAARSLRERVAEASIRETGIPVDPEFRSPPSRGRARSSLGLDPGRPVVLVMSGGLGLDIVPRVRAVLAGAPEEARVLAVCGRNEEARSELAEDADGGRLRVFGYVQGVATLMAAADLVVTKPGGLSVSETLAVGRPLILSRPLPGHEEGNMSALVGAGAALYADEDGGLTDAVRTLLGDRSALERLASRARTMGRPGAAAEIAREIVDRVSEDRAEAALGS